MTITLPGLLASIAMSTALLLTAAAVHGATEIYKHVDAEGNVTFSDQPPSAGQSAEKIQLQQLNTTPPTTPATRAPAPAERESEQSIEPTFAISIASPEEETTIGGPGNVTVTAQAEPPLGSLEQLQLLIDGEAHGEPQRGTTWYLEGLLRGPHDLSVERLDRRGNLLARSDSVRIYVVRPSLNQPQRR